MRCNTSCHCDHGCQRLFTDKTELTFDEWKQRGYHVVRSERSRSRNAQGQATFHNTQVTPNAITPYDNLDIPKDMTLFDFMGDRG